MEEVTEQMIARRLAPRAAEGVTENRDAINRLSWLFMRALRPLPEPDPDTIWLPDGPEAHWLTPAESHGGGWLVSVTAKAKPNPDDESRPFVVLVTEAKSLHHPGRSVDLHSEYTRLDERLDGFKTRWVVRDGASELFSVEGRCAQIAQLADEWQTDAAEEFARLLARRMGFAAA